MFAQFNILGLKTNVFLHVHLTFMQIILTVFVNLHHSVHPQQLQIQHLKNVFLLVHIITMQIFDQHIFYVFKLAQKIIMRMISQKLVF